MKRFLLLSLLLIPLFLPAQYEVLRDCRSGKNVNYAGPLLPGRTVMVPKNPVFRKSSFRGVWVATVENIDIPCCANADQFRRAYQAILRNLKNANATAVIFQVRPMNDAFYPSRFNPWSRYLTGTEGRSPGFDPLEYMVRETHRAGLEFHAWLNPYRVGQFVKTGVKTYLDTLSPQNFARKNRDLVLGVPMGKNQLRLILDPGNPRTIQFFTGTVQEILMKYPVDAIHLDDYFYPYEKMGSIDAASFRKYNPKRLPLEEWRRENVNALVQSVSQTIRNFNRKYGRRVQFGISPFGIWANRTTRPEGSLTKGTESYVTLHADSRKWVRSGWVDYIAPQLYWTFGNQAAGYAALADWWNNVCRGTRVKLYIGQAPAYLGTRPEWMDPMEIWNQMRYDLRLEMIRGEILYSYSKVFAPKNQVMRAGCSQVLRAWRSAR